MTIAVPAFTRDQINALFNFLLELYPEDVDGTDDVVEDAVEPAEKKVDDPDRSVRNYHKQVDEGDEVAVAADTAVKDIGMYVRTSMYGPVGGIRCADALLTVQKDGNLPETLFAIKYGFGQNYKAYQSPVVHGVSKALLDVSHPSVDAVIKVLGGNFFNFKSEVMSIYGSFNSASVRKYVMSKIEENS